MCTKSNPKSVPVDKTVNKTVQNKLPQHGQRLHTVSRILCPSSRAMSNAGHPLLNDNCWLQRGFCTCPCAKAVHNCCTHLPCGPASTAASVRGTWCFTRTQEVYLKSKKLIHFHYSVKHREDGKQRGWLRSNIPIWCRARLGLVSLKGSDKGGMLIQEDTAAR